jgi:hypothetical protein
MMILRRRERERGGARREINAENLSVKPVTLALLVSCFRVKKSRKGGEQR